MVVRAVVAMLLTLALIVGFVHTHPHKPFHGKQFLVTPWNDPYIRLAERCTELTHEQCAMLKKLVTLPKAIWLGVGDIDEELALLAHVLHKAHTSGQVPLFVLYHIPDRDCGAGARNSTPVTADDYTVWVKKVGNVLQQYPTPLYVLLEPDALADAVTAPHELCAGRNKADVLTERIALLQFSIGALNPHNSPTMRVFVDAGNPEWIATDAEKDALATALAQIYREGAFQGISGNVANHYAFSTVSQWGQDILSRIQKKTGAQLTIAIDTGRSGLPVKGWCNARGAALGELPSLTQESPSVEFTAIIKPAGESDAVGAECNYSTPSGEYCSECLKDFLTHSARMHQ